LTDRQLRAFAGAVLLAAALALGLALALGPAPEPVLEDAELEDALAPAAGGAPAEAEPRGLGALLRALRGAQAE